MKSLGNRMDDRRGFTLIELLVVIAVITILAALLLPALAQGKAQAQSTACKNHLRQMSIAMRMYVDDAQYYPNAEFYYDNGGPTVARIEWLDLMRPYYPLEWTNRLFHCPAYKGYVAPPQAMFLGSPYLGSYAYNGWGTGNSDQGLGLGPESVSDYRRKACAASRVLAPSDMIVFSESLLQSFSLSAANSTPLWCGSDYMGQVISRLPAGFRYPAWHGPNCNIAFCDTHVESIATLKLFNPTNTAVRWNNDHQPHPETW